MAMPFILRTSIAFENEFVKTISGVRRTLKTTPNWTLRIQQERQQLTRWKCRQVNSMNRNTSSNRLDETKQPLRLLNSTASVINQTAVLNMNVEQSCPHSAHRLSTTTTDDQKEKGENGPKNDKLPLQMPDKDIELKLADLQATITEEYKLGNFTRALSSSKDLLKQTQQHFGFNVDHPATASAMNNVGLMHKLLGNFTEARQHYVGAMRIYASVCGRDHASYAMTLHNLGNLNKSQVHFDDSLKATERLSLVEAAMEYLEEAYAIRVAELGAEHPHTIATRSAIGSTLAAQVLYQHKMVEDTNHKSSGDYITSNNTRKQYVALDPHGITQQQWRAAEEHLRASLQTAIENPRGQQIQNNQNRKNHEKGKKKGRKQGIKQQPSRYNSNLVPSSNFVIATLSAASAAQNLAVFLKSLSMTFDEDSPLRKDHMYEAKDLYEKVQEARTHLLPYDHPDLYATKYSLAELLEVLAASPSSGVESKNDEERQRHKEAANALRQEIIDTYNPPDLQQQKEGSTDSKMESGSLDVVVQKTKGSKE